MFMFSKQLAQKSMKQFVLENYSLYTRRYQPELKLFSTFGLCGEMCTEFAILLWDIVMNTLFKK